jgi:hypothetical protein
MDEIYVKLLGEGTEVYRPVPATKLGPAVYMISRHATYNSSDETWEFKPGSTVVVEERLLSGKNNLVATRLEP